MTPAKGAHTISYFIGTYAYLSNFYPTPIFYDSFIWPSVEHAYQAAKTTNPVSKTIIRLCGHASRAKTIGKGVLLRSDWEQVKRSVMADILKVKFKHGGALSEKLVSTFPSILIEGNHWGDKYWGCTRQGEVWVGENWLGKLLMDRRAELMDKHPNLFEAK